MCQGGCWHVLSRDPMDAVSHSVTHRIASQTNDDPGQMSSWWDFDTLVRVRVLHSARGIKPRENISVFNGLFIVMSLLRLFFMPNPSGLKHFFFLLFNVCSYCMHSLEPTYPFTLPLQILLTPQGKAPVVSLLVLIISLTGSQRICNQPSGCKQNSFPVPGRAVMVCDMSRGFQKPFLSANTTD